jgi:hypothetical protein
VKVFKALFFLSIAVIGTSCLQNDMIDPVDCSMSNINLEFQVQDTDCGLSEGQIEVTVTGGTAPFMYRLDDGPEQSSALFTDLAAGDYQVTVKDGNDCTKTETVSVSNTGGLQVSAMMMPSDCTADTGKIIITASGGVEPYSYQLGSGSAQSSNEFTVGAGDYVVTTTDNNGCSFESSITVLTNTSFQTNVSPIIMSSCAVSNCHDGSNPNRVNFTVFSNVQARASMIKTRTQNGSMPPNGTLTQAQKDIIACWVDDGAKDN